MSGVLPDIGGDDGSTVDARSAKLDVGDVYSDMCPGDSAVHSRPNI